MKNRKLQDQFMLRLPDGMREKIKNAAVREGRSMNAQIVQHLRTIYQPNTQEEAEA